MASRPLEAGSLSGRPGRAARTLTPYPEVDQIAAQVLAGVGDALSDSFVGMYLGGSLATGTFNPQTSDIDFVVVTKGDVSDDLAAPLRRAHDRITAGPSKWAKKLEGLYIPLQTLRTRLQGAERCVYLGVGDYLTTGDYQSDWIVQLHLVRERVIVVSGPDPKTLVDPGTPEELRASCAAIMRDWEPLLEDTERFDAEYRAYTVLTMCRVLYTLEHGAILPKTAAAGWARDRYGSLWGALIDKAGAWRHGMLFDNLDEVLGLLRYTIERSTEGDHKRVGRSST